MDKPLSECGTWISGGTPSRQVQSYWNGDVPWISAATLKEFFIEDSDQHVTEVGIANGSRAVNAGALLLLVRGMSLKTEFRLGIARRRVAFNQDVKAIVPSDDLDPYYLAYAVRAATNEVLDMVEEAGHGTGVLPTDRLKALRIPVPRRAVQEGIALLCRTIDEKIAVNRKSNTALEALSYALFKSWFIDFDPVVARHEGRQPVGTVPAASSIFPAHFQESDLGPIPQGWNTSTIGNEVIVVGGSTPRTNVPEYWQSGTHLWVTPRDLSRLSDPVVLESERCISDAGLAQISSGLLPTGTVLLSSRAPIGYTAIAGVPLAINQGFIAMRCERMLGPQFVLQWTRDSIEEIIARAGGTTFAEISKSTFRSIPLVIPTESVAQLFETQSATWYDQIVRNVRETRALISLRNLLLPKMFSGEIHLKVAEQLASSAV